MSAALLIIARTLNVLGSIDIQVTDYKVFRVTIFNLNNVLI